MAPRSMPRPPRLDRQTMADLPPAFREYLERQERWQQDIFSRVREIIGEMDADKTKPPLPTLLMKLPYALLTLAAASPGGAPGLAYVPDAPGGVALAFRDGTAWRLFRPSVLGFKAADQAFSTTALADVDDMSFAAKQNVRYTFRFDVRFSSAAVTTGLALAVTSTVTNSVLNGNIRIPQAVDGVDCWWEGAYTGNDDAVTCTDVPTTGVYVAVVEGIFLNVNQDCTVKLRAASEVGASAVTIRANSAVTSTVVG